MITAVVKPIPETTYGQLVSRETTSWALVLAITISAIWHAFIIFGVSFSLPKPQINPNLTQSLEVVLVNSKSSRKPKHAQALAQTNLDGGGNTEKERLAKTPLPPSKTDPQIQLNNRVSHLEEKAKKLMTQIDAKRRIEQSTANAVQQDEPSDALDSEQLMQRSLELARLQGQVSKEWDEYQKRPRQKYIGARTQEFRFAQYVEDWRLKIERVGTLNYPEEARRQKIYGSLKLTVSIRADGSVKNIEVDRSSGHKVLDAAAIRIVQLAAPFAPFPPDIQTDTDILNITRTWTFTLKDELVGE